MITDGVARYRPEHDVKLLTYGSFVDDSVLLMEINPLRSNSSTITDIVVFLWNRHGRRILFFFTPRPFLTSVVCVTLHGTLLIARGQRAFFVLVFSFFSMVSNVVDTM